MFSAVGVVYCVWEELAKHAFYCDFDMLMIFTKISRRRKFDSLNESLIEIGMNFYGTK
jgi:hypothetical protein